MLPPSPKLIEFVMKAVKVELVQKVNEEVTREETGSSESIEKALPMRTPEKSGRFLAGQDEVITPAMMEMSAEV